MSTKTLAKLVAHGELSKGEAVVTLVGGKAIGNALGLAAKARAERRFHMPYESVAAAVATTLSASPSGLHVAVDTQRGSYLEGAMPADMLSARGILAFDVHDLGADTEVIGASVVPGQAFAWGKGQASLRHVLDRVAEMAARL